MVVIVKNKDAEGNPVLPEKGPVEIVVKKQDAEEVVTMNHADGTVTEKKAVIPGEKTLSGPTANVNVNASRRMSDGNYGSYGVGVSLTLPSLTDEDSVDKAYETARAWVDKRMQELIAGME